MLRWMNIRYLIRTSSYSYSVSSPSTLDTKQVIHEQTTADENTRDNDEASEKSNMVSAAFASLKEISLKKSKLPPCIKDLNILAAKDVNSLLAEAETKFVSRHHALKIMSILADWASKGHIKFSDFETDARFAKLCGVLSKKYNTSEDAGDLSLVLGVTGDDQAAKLISSISLPQMVNVLSSLCAKGKRSTPLLRSLSFHIGKETSHLNIKEAADVLYACSLLNFPDEVLLEKVSADVILCINDTKKAAVIRSITTSVGLLKYKNIDLIDSICHWIITNKEHCRLQECSSVLLTLASVNYTPQCLTQLLEALEPYITVSESKNLYTWLDMVWSLVVLQKANNDHISSVLDHNFVSKLISKSEKSCTVSKLKLLNINGYAQLKNDYKGPLLSNESDVFKVSILRTKEKQHLVQSVIDTLSNLAPSASYFRTDVDTGMGFLIDIECRVIEKLSFVPVDDPSFSDNSATKIALMVCGYHDVCRGAHNEFTGIMHLTQYLTALSGYEIITIPYTEFDPKDKIINRVNYLEKKLKQISLKMKT